MVISDEFPFSKKASKYFVGYENNEEVTSLCVLLPKMRWYVKHFDGAKAMCFFLMKDEKLLIKYKEIWSEMLKIMKRKKSIAAKCLAMLATNT